MADMDRLLMLFRAFRERNDEAFRRVAEAIISAELAANHHSYARDLQKALAPGHSPRVSNRKMNGLSSLPKDRRNGEQLVAIQQPSLDLSRLVFLPDAKERISRVVEEHGQRVKLASFGLKPKSKLLFWGPPGCGKTMTAHWLAQKMGLPIGLVRLNALITSYLGETASHIQRVFDLAQSMPMLLLLDEVDAIGKDRDDAHDVGELKRVVNSMLQAVDSFNSSESILVAASNHQHLLDPALWRRFDEIVLFPKPGPVEIRTYLKHLLNGVSVADGIEPICRSMKALSFAEIERNVTEAVKSMILEDRPNLKTAEIVTEVRRFKKSQAAARQKPPRKRTDQ
jgi:SpoVK/Ycf46/Vps4 family AAA+-type ATPase